MFALGTVVVAQYQPTGFIEGKIAAIGKTDDGGYFYKVETESSLLGWIDGKSVFVEIESSTFHGASDEEKASIAEARRRAQGESS